MNQCKCGSTNLHVFFRYKSKGEQRFKCNDCQSWYRNINGVITEMIKPDITQEQVKSLRQLFSE